MIDFAKRNALLGLLILLAFGLRLLLLSDMEYNYDEWKAWELAGETLRGERMPLVGLDSSVGIPNPPGFVVLVALFRATIRTPLGTAAIIAILNAAAIIGFLLYFRSRCDRFVVWTAAFLFATTPWAVIFSRKIWAQDLLAPFSVLLMICLHKAVVGKSPRCWLGVAFAAFMLMQLHLSAIYLVAAIPLILLAYGHAPSGGGWSPGKDDWTWMRRGLLAGAILFAPYVLLILKNFPYALRSLQASRIPDYSWVDHLVASLKGGAQIVSGLFFDTTLLDDVGQFHAFGCGIGRGISLVVYPVLLVMYVAGLATWVRDRNRGFLGLYGMTMVGVHFAYILLASSRTGASYFLILYPVPFLAVACGLALIRNAAVRKGLATFAVGVNVGITLLFLAFVHRHPEGIGGYGVPYRHQTQQQGE